MVPPALSRAHIVELSASEPPRSMAPVVTSDGVATVYMVVVTLPTPTVPTMLLPQHQTAPLATAQTVASPPAMAVAPVRLVPQPTAEQVVTAAGPYAVLPEVELPRSPTPP